MADQTYTEERYLRERLQMLQEAYQREARPLIERLVSIESMKPPAPICITVEQAAQLGFPTTSQQNKEPAHGE